ncbi:MAG: DNA polymerase IV, partial [Candidatus Nanopelagicales bacterium]|nr:DNA polymerase IV [Candidatus Nanopelagicales bacterium]
PVIVGGGQRGVVLSGTYEARALGIHSAMPMSRARRIAPQAIVIEPHHERYAEVSAGIMAIFSSVTPIVEPLSLDEAFLNVSGALRRLGSATAIAELIRARVYDEQRITCSVGVASTKFVAKLASTQAKPDGLLVVPIDKVTAFLHPLPVGALWGVGERTEERLVSLGLRTVGDLAHTPVETLTRALGQASGDRLHDLAWGRDERGVVPDAVEKSIGNEETFARDIDDPEMIHREILRLAQKVAARVRRQGHLGRTVVLKVRFADFTTITRSRTLETPTDVGQVIYTTAVELYAALRLQRARIRLVGVRLEGLLDAATRVEQLIFDDSAADPADRRAAEVAADRLRERFGRDVVRPARLWDPQP